MSFHGESPAVNCSDKDLLTPACYSAEGPLTRKLYGQHEMMWMRLVVHVRFAGRRMR